MKKLLVSTAFIFAGFVAMAQQDAQFTQNMFNKLSINPGSAGHNGGICATLLTRSQWMGFDGRELKLGVVRIHCHQLLASRCTENLEG